MTIEEYEARAEAFTECANHLELAWTDEPLERKAGDELVKEFRAQAEANLDIARAMRTNTRLPLA